MIKIKWQKVIAFLCVESVFLSGCSTANQVNQFNAESSAQTGTATKEIEVFNDVYTVPESAFLVSDADRPDKGEEDNVEYLVFENDENDPEEKWRNQVIFVITEGTNITPNITYDMGKVVLDDYVNAWIGYNSSGLEDMNKEYFELPQTPAYQIITPYPNGNGTNTFWFFMNSYGDVMTIRFCHSDKAKTDYTSTFNEMVQNVHIKGLDGELAFKDTYGSSSATATDSSFTNKFGTPTTLCAHPNCKNYIASSGDTNCCTEHSSKCLNCGKYIDEDAMYCMDCIEGSLSNNSDSNRNGLCEFKENGKYVCDKKAVSGKSFCQEHWDLLYDSYSNLTGN